MYVFLSFFREPLDRFTERSTLTAMSQRITNVLLVDNYDSFTWNLSASLRMEGATVTVRSRDDLDLRSVLDEPPVAIVLSPGPGSPSEALPVLHLLERLPSSIPVLGVCLGFQCMAHFLGYPIRRVAPIHGHRRPITHRGESIFCGLPDPLMVARYHSLGLTIADCRHGPLRILATNDDDGLVMAFRCEHRPWIGVQFHPESFATDAGGALIRNFLETTT